MKSSSVSLLLQSIWRNNYRGISLTYGLTIVENVCSLLYAAATGFAIDGLLKGNPTSLIPLILLSCIHLTVGLFRHVYDTKVFVGIYSRVASDMVARQRQKGIEGTRIIGRVSLSRELVDFFQMELPAVASTVIQFVGATLMLFIYDPLIGVFALIAMIPITLMNRWFGKRSYRLNRALNDRIEKEADIIVNSSLKAIVRHFFHLKFWRVKISNAEAGTWGLVEIVVIVLTIATLLRFSDSGAATAGTIYAVLSYVRMFQGSVNELPIIVQNVSRVYDIGERVSGDVN
ncbi:ABC transporter six-transmembrane domain-containing protein [Paenibacillus sp. MZ04-78.2]|uniref:ABC transporter six-transmembrane domain-containing protein n=1 Tax=Paenibacillus sp. MZ04-78.2 TaxID=2962034 RepID=UPI0020B79FE5|nr:ABC transporter six-transmembrane domain-containing protein [Paenibacillus sp. MZ04-78.2]MCP3773116.1 ABC transporter six-transmembrane domain-containing protein [Paenibacillus sp. MZ04-78.2]